LNPNNRSNNEGNANSKYRWGFFSFAAVVGVDNEEEVNRKKKNMECNFFFF
jgi:hypothetical protein